MIVRRPEASGFRPTLEFPGQTTVACCIRPREPRVNESYRSIRYHPTMIHSRVGCHRHTRRDAKSLPNLFRVVLAQFAMLSKFSRVSLCAVAPDHSCQPAAALDHHRFARPGLEVISQPKLQNARIPGAQNAPKRGRAHVIHRHGEVDAVQ